MAARLKEVYESEIKPAMMSEFGYKNIMQVPKLEKIVINMGVGDATKDPKLLEAAMEELAVITGQKPSVRAARKSISSFKLREGQKIGCTVTLRGQVMYEFLDRLISVAIPRIRDFRGIPKKSFDPHGNYTLGLRDQTIFPEVDQDKVTAVRGMNVTIVIARSNEREQNFALLKKFGMPFVN